MITLMHMRSHTRLAVVPRTGKQQGASSRQLARCVTKGASSSLNSVQVWLPTLPALRAFFIHGQAPGQMLLLLLLLPGHRAHTDKTAARLSCVLTLSQQQQ